MAGREELLGVPALQDAPHRAIRLDNDRAWRELVRVVDAGVW
jgi:hypothetical protein